MLTANAPPGPVGEQATEGEGVGGAAKAGDRPTFVQRMALPENRRRVAPTTAGGYADALREVVSRVAGGRERLGEEDIAALREQVDRLQVLLQSRSGQLRWRREVVIKGPPRRFL